MVFLFLYLFLSKVPLYGGESLVHEASGQTGLFGHLSTFFVGAGQDKSLLALGLAPLMALFFVFSLTAREEHGPLGLLTRRQRSQFLSWGILFFSLVQGLAFLQAGGISWTSQPLLAGSLLSQLLAGSFLTLFLMDLNQAYGLGGISLFILISLLSRDLPDWLTRWNQEGVGLGMMILVLVLLYFFASIEKARLSYPMRSILLQGEKKGTLDLPLNLASSFPLIYGLAISQILQASLELLLGLTFSSQVSNLLYGLVVLLVTLFYCQTLYGAKKLAHDLEKNGQILLSLSPGSVTKRFLASKIRILALFSSVYLLVLAFLPVWFGPEWGQIPAMLMIYVSLVFQVVDPWRIYRGSLKSRKDW